ncbi:hypothetical protein [Marivita sp. GX14005]|uniref:hypothetical protein n=1 Tax=Marivita sp. GX14005 TaxID=2942276 RepID=UPI0020192AC9|nr:hypothetical protein [Marivita sp. GX14005]MCL3882764.1 hypothetical protein [Marivita sp. GX14005]
MIRAAAISGLMACAASVLPAVEVGQSEYRFVSELTADGFIPFGTGGSGNTLFGMSKGREIYLCFILDTAGDQAERQSVLLSELSGTPESRTLPNIPVVCVLTQ